MSGLVPLHQSEVDRLIEFVTSSCGPSRSELVAGFLVGSRLWGNATHRSDIDAIVVHASSARIEGKKAMSGKGFDIQVMNTTEFERRCRGHEPNCLLCLWIPSEAMITFGSKSVTEYVAIVKRSVLPLDRCLMIEQARDMARRDGEKAEKFHFHRDFHMAKKVYVHTHRHLMLMAELMATAGDLSPERFSEVSLAASEFIGSLHNVFGADKDELYAVVRPVLTSDLARFE